MADKDVDNVEDEQATIATDLVVTKYKMAAEIVNEAVKKVVEKLVAGAKVMEICVFSDNFLQTETGKVFKKEKEMKKGISFPTCISVNNCVGHFSPLSSDPDVELKDGDLVKIDLGVHIDGFPAMIAHTHVVGASKTNKVTGKKADAILAAHYAAEAALRMVAPGKENFPVTDLVQKIADIYHCKPMEGIMSHQVKQHVIDGEKAFITNPTDAQKKEYEKCEFDVHEVYAIDIVISSGEGKGREIDTRTTVYKRKDLIYQLKMKLSRQFFSDVEKKFGFMPFNLRMLEQETKARMGVKECVEHGLLEPFPVTYEREGEVVAQFKYTLLLMPNGQMRITQGPAFDPELYESQYKIEDPEILATLNASTSRKTAKKKKKKAEKSATDAAEAGDA